MLETNVRYPESPEVGAFGLLGLKSQFLFTLSTAPLFLLLSSTISPRACRHFQEYIFTYYQPVF